jgi:hypothetical protein
MLRAKEVARPIIGPESLLDPMDPMAARRLLAKFRVHRVATPADSFVAANHALPDYTAKPVENGQVIAFAYRLRRVPSGTAFIVDCPDDALRSGFKETN